MCRCVQVCAGVCRCTCVEKQIWMCVVCMYVCVCARARAFVRNGESNSAKNRRKALLNQEQRCIAPRCIYINRCLQNNTPEYKIKRERKAHMNERQNKWGVLVFLDQSAQLRTTKKTSSGLADVALRTPCVSMSTATAFP